MHAAGGDGTNAAARRFPWLLALVGLLAFAVREQFVLGAVVAVPLRGDIIEYANYAWNLVHHGVMSIALPNPTVAPAPDAYRLPGYPLLIALGMTLFEDNARWIAFVLQVQVVLGTATVVMCGLLARQWLAPAWALAAALILALWPHHIAASGVMLSEVVFGFSLIAGLYAFALAWRGERLIPYLLAGFVFAYAWLVNPLLLPFPFALAALAWWHGRPKQAAALLAVFLVPVIAMAVRDARLDVPESGSVQRARLNFVQGSWPDYHNAAVLVRDGHPTAVWITEQINRETQALREDPRSGFAGIAERFADAPGFYASWYVSKTWQLWGWRIRIGSNPIHFLEIERSPFERSPMLRGIVATYEAVNPLLTTLTLIGCVVLVVAGSRRTRWVPVAAVGGLGLYFTLAHMLLQAEPRYAIAYRGIEAVIVVTVLGWAFGRLRMRRR